MLKFRNVSKSFGKKNVLHAINCSFEKGKTYGIVGANGAGKTTLFRCIAGMEVYEGLIESEKISLKDSLGFLQTNPLFISRITGWEYLKLLCVARNIETEDFEAHNFFDLPLNEYAENYSTGMKKKLALMGILLQQNEYFILDEPYNGVDINSNFIITEIIQKLKAAGKTILIASHIFSTLESICDEIWVLQDGSFSKRVEPKDFQALDQEMRNIVLGEKVLKYEI